MPVSERKGAPFFVPEKSSLEPGHSLPNPAGWGWAGVLDYGFSSGGIFKKRKTGEFFDQKSEIGNFDYGIKPFILRNPHHISGGRKVTVHRFRVQRSGLGTGTKLKTRSPRKKCWFCHIIAKYHVPDLWGCGSGRFSRTKRLQNDVW